MTFTSSLNLSCMNLQTFDTYIVDREILYSLPAGFNLPYHKQIWRGPRSTSTPIESSSGWDYLFNIEHFIVHAVRNDLVDIKPHNRLRDMQSSQHLWSKTILIRQTESTPDVGSYIMTAYLSNLCQHIIPLQRNYCMQQRSCSLLIGALVLNIASSWEAHAMPSGSNLSIKALTSRTTGRWYGTDRWRFMVHHISFPLRLSFLTLL